MNEAMAQSGIGQAVESKRNKKGKGRVQARHLSPILHRVIVDTFHVKRSSEDVAEDLRLPVRAVTDVLLMEAFRVRRAS